MLHKLEFVFEAISDKENWRDFLEKNKITDVYYRYEYSSSFASMMNAEAVLLAFYKGNEGFCFPVLIRCINKEVSFRSFRKEIFDMETPYGYGGPYFFGDFAPSIETKKQFREKLLEYCSGKNIVSLFIRFYPLIWDNSNAFICDDFCFCKSTVCMDTSSPDILLANLDNQYRRKRRISKEQGVRISHDNGDAIDVFKELYAQTMKNHMADDFYFFSDDYYSSILNDFGNNVILFYAEYKERIVGASLFLFDEEVIHYHLGGRDYNYSDIPFEVHLMTEAGIWASERGIAKMHLGGGVTEGDGLFRYKKKYNKKGVLPFYIGRIIFDSSTYNELLEYRKLTDSSFEVNEKMLIQYRG